MTKEEAKQELEGVKLIYEIFKKGINEYDKRIAELEAIINKKDDWRDEVPHLTLEQNQLISNKIQLMQEMHAFAHVKNEGWLPDWKDDLSLRWGLTMDSFEGVSLNGYFSYNAFVFGIAVKSKEVAEEMLKEFGERIEEIYNKQY